PGSFRCPDAGAWTGALKVTAGDLARNITVREIAGAPAPAVVSEPQPGRTEVRSDKPAGVAGPDLGTPDRVNTPPPLLPPRVQAGGGPTALPAPPPPPAVTPQPAPGTTLPAAANREPSPSGILPVSNVTREPAAAGHDLGPIPRQLINHTHVVMDYRIDQVGP